jgi:hypothetical protein
MTTSIYFAYGTVDPIRARIVFRGPELMRTSLSPEDVPVECGIQLLGRFAEWSAPDLAVYPQVFADAFADLAYRFIRIHEALGRGPYSRVIARSENNEAIVYRKRSAENTESVPPARWAHIDLHTNSAGTFQWVRYANSRDYEHLFRAAVVRLLRHEIAVKAGYGLKPSAPFGVLLSRLNQTGALFHNAAVHRLGAYPQGPFG